MTIKRLKEWIADIPDDARIYLDDGTSVFEGNTEIVALASYVEPYDKKIIVQTKSDFDVREELNARLEYYSENDYDELDAFMEMAADGYTPDDFDYDHYYYAKNFYEEHGLI